MRYPEQLKQVYDHHAEHLERCLHALNEYRQRCNDASFNELRELANLGQFVLIVQYDLRTIGTDCEAADRNWRRNLYVRHMATLIHESVEDLRHLCGETLRSDLSSYTPPNTLQDLRPTLRGLSGLVNAHAPTLHRIRNVVSAHRDHDASAQLAMMEATDVEAIMELNAGYITWLDELLQLIDRVIVHSFPDLQHREKG